ncbi:hypothetical protein PsAD46_05288 [Pseudovibrio sp. Ad46]|nr:hypothetical protein PsAD46_05288 [Pseudovibrio sp. Ad46]KZL01396.1 hypothetical protein PsAD5_00629 [Pseudovibrio sp. Ad5]
MPEMINKWGGAGVAGFFGGSAIALWVEVSTTVGYMAIVVVCILIFKVASMAFHLVAKPKRDE